MRILHFVGKGKGWMEGIEEYVIITEDEREVSSVDGFKCPGFVLESETDIEDLPNTLPFETTLIPHR